MFFFFSVGFVYLYFSFTQVNQTYKKQPKPPLKPSLASPYVLLRSDVTALEQYFFPSGTIFYNHIQNLANIYFFFSPTTQSVILKTVTNKEKCASLLNLQHQALR